MDPTPPSDAPHHWLLITGNVVSGLTFQGPYGTEDDALAAQTDYEVQGGGPAVVARLYNPS
jgi:hypothetical protein